MDKGEPRCTITSGSINKLAACLKDHLRLQYGADPDIAHDWVILSTPESAFHGRRRVLVEIEVTQTEQP